LLSNYFTASGNNPPETLIAGNIVHGTGNNIGIIQNEGDGEAVPSAALYSNHLAPHFDIEKGE
jgi:hypothetical protein